ncbi:MAG: DUF3341 domain-containing protein, partial [Rhodococcus sp.]|nr:DUF3341 domain-containing protein [Rhodococcus sp. (in: high G+C Gram-positive bacteria)]
MSEHVTPPTPASGEPRIVGTLAEFTGPKELIAAVRAIRKKGYKRVEAFSPFPIHGIDDALEAKPSILPWVVLGAGIAGCVVAVLMQWYMNAYEAAHPFSGYRYAISGKPFWSLPANIPVTFELIILFSAFTAFLGMIAFNKLPQFANPLFASKRFRKVTDDRFFLLVDAHDSLYAESSVRTALESIGSSHVETIRDLPAEPLPRVIRPLMGLLAVVALLPLAYFALVSTGTSQNPRIYIWWDMDFQPKFKAQTLVKAAETELVKRNREEHKAPGFSERLFPQGRASRLPVDGTVARGTLMLDYRLRTGIEPDGEETTPVALQEAEASAAAPEGAAGEAGTEGAATPPEPNWITRFPDSIVVNQQTMDRGRQRYDIYCAVCHGVAGDGDGLVSQRAMMLQQGTWTQAAKLDAEAIRNQPVGKIYDTITNGRGRMRGYRAQIPVEDRWAITLYVKALQRSRNVSVDALPEGISVDDLAPMVRDPNAEQSEG